MGSEVWSISTSSYRAYRPDMGAAVRTSLKVPAWFDHQIVGYVQEAAPRWSYFRAEADEFDRQYLAQLDRFGVDHFQLAFNRFREISGVTSLVLLCWETGITGPADCHRRLFAEWWTVNTGEMIPELDLIRGAPVEDPQLPLEGLE